MNIKASGKWLSREARIAVLTVTYSDGTSPTNYLAGPDAIVTLDPSRAWLQDPHAAVLADTYAAMRERDLTWDEMQARHTPPKVDPC